MPDVKVIRIILVELERAAKVVENYTLLDLLEEKFRSILRSEGYLYYYKEKFSREFYNFLEIYLAPTKA
jgi:hypothetical protein